MTFSFHPSKGFRVTNPPACCLGILARRAVSIPPRVSELQTRALLLNLITFFIVSIPPRVSELQTL